VNVSSDDARPDWVISADGEVIGVIEAKMNARGWRNADLARRAGISESQVGRLLSGKRSLTPAMLAAISDAFGTSTYLLRAEAGVLTDEEQQRVRRRQPFEDYVADDPWLSEEAKRSLTAIYRDLVRAAQASRHAEGSAPADRPQR
jgi:transcriptional regulator with XRE-family HTH domain